MEQLTATVKQNAENARPGEQPGAERVWETAQKGGKVVDNVGANHARHHQAVP